MTATTTIHVTRLPHGAGLDLPSYATAQSAGMDLMAAIAEPAVLQPGARAIIPTGLAIALAPDFEAQIRPRSGLSAKNGVTVLNSPGTIDADYRGEIGLILINNRETAFSIEHGMRHGPMVIAPGTQAGSKEVDRR